MGVESLASKTNSTFLLYVGATYRQNSELGQSALNGVETLQKYLYR